MSIPEKKPLEIYIDKDYVIFKKYSTANTCMLTNEITEKPFILGNGKIVLIQKGVELLLHEINKKFNIPSDTL